jgi:hypothetical protein
MQCRMIDLARARADGSISRAQRRTLPHGAPLLDEKDRVSIRLVQEMAKPFAELRAADKPEVERLGLDFGLAMLIATRDGALFGAGLINDLTRIDKQIARCPPPHPVRRQSAG